MGLADLHTHSYYSDGNRSPLDLLRIAVAQKVETLAITDHNTAAGYREGAPYAAEMGVRLIPGIEMVSGGDKLENPSPECDVDILGYFMDIDNPAFKACEKASQQDATGRIHARCEKLNQLGYPVEMDAVYTVNPRYPSTASIARVLMDRNCAQDHTEAYQIISQSNCAVSPPKLSIEACIRTIHKAGGVAVLAHPCPQYVRYRGKRLGAEGLQLFIDWGLDGIEVSHPKLTAMDRQHFRMMAKRFGLLPGGGSDEHSFIGCCIVLGSQDVESSWADALEQKAQQYKALNP